MARPVDLIYRFIGDTRSLERATGTADRAFGTLTRAAGVAAGAMAAAWSAKQVYDQARAFISLGDSVRIAGENASEILGPAYEGLTERLDEFRGAMGITAGEMDAIIAQMGLMTEGAGLSDDAQAEMIGNMVERAGDLAAWRGDITMATDALDAMQAAIRGEFDPLEQFGVKLKQVDITARAKELMALDETLSENEAQMRAVADLIDQQAAPAIGELGDAADTTTGKLTSMETALRDAREEAAKEFVRGMDDAARGAEYVGDESVSGADKLRALAQGFINAVTEGSVFTMVADEQARKLEEMAEAASGGAARINALGSEIDLSAVPSMSSYAEALGLAAGNARELTEAQLANRTAIEESYTPLQSYAQTLDGIIARYRIMKGLQPNWGDFGPTNPYLGDDGNFNPYPNQSNNTYGDRLNPQ